MNEELGNLVSKWSEKSKGSAKPPKSASKTSRTGLRGSKGEELFNQLVHLTGIPAKTIKDELKSILERKNIDLNRLTLDQLRVVIASYLREIMGSLLDGSRIKKREQH